MFKINSGSIISRLQKHRFLFIGVLVKSFLQSFVLTIGSLDYDSALRVDIYIPFAAYDINLVNILFMILIRIVPLFIIQFVLGLWWCSAKDIKEKKIIAIILSVSPIFIPGYIFSPLFSIGVIISFFDGTLTAEDISEGWMFSLATMGFYCLFWLYILIKSFVSSEE
ncbi:MAG: hypothetical protein RLZZ04_4523 [Cyanobacteriota bacterium]|jgi:hypothetical protein